MFTSPGCKQKASSLRGHFSSYNLLLISIDLASSAAAAAPAAPLAAPPAAIPVPAGPSAFTLAAAGQTHAVELLPADAGALAVVLDGARYDVRRDSGDRTKLLVNGRAHTVDVKEVAGSVVTVVIDGMTHKLEMGRGGQASRTFSLASGGRSYKVEMTGGDGAASVVLDGTAYRVERDKADPGLVVVNGQAHTVAVKESAGNAVTVVIATGERSECFLTIHAEKSCSFLVVLSVAEATKRG